MLGFSKKQENNLSKLKNVMTSGVGSWCLLIAVQYEIAKNLLIVNM